jgi:hypothetical protein
MSLSNRKEWSGGAEFEAACGTVWAETVRGDLVVAGQLQLCKGCLAFYRPDDPLCTHPASQAVAASVFCAEHGVSCEQTLASALWAVALEAWPALGETPLPRCSPQHPGRPPVLQVPRVSKAATAELMRRLEAVEEAQRRSEQALAEHRRVQLRLTVQINLLTEQLHAAGERADELQQRLDWLLCAFELLRPGTTSFRGSSRRTCG